MEKPKIIVILGQTSTGKSDFAVEIAQKYNSEIISADSRQVYKGMDLGTGKITKKEMCGVPHYLLDVVSPLKTFSVSDFKKLADKKIEEILKKQKVPIICGGTGFYIDTIINGTVYPEVIPDKELRVKLSLKTTTQLFDILKKLDSERAESIDKNNTVRLIRAIEIAKTLGKVPKMEINSNYNVLKIGLTLPSEILKERIRNRLLSRIKKGMLNEIKKLHDMGLTWKRMNELGLEYRYGALYLQGKSTKEEMIEKICTETWHYAKRQNTWFKRDKNTIWINPTNKIDKDEAFKEISNFLK
ncbi:MAG: tRNA (adenosine(37)-N6)-dimethylallyltransferase MiaA [Candidatus Nomurabacteria bacterium]|nr:tRNA (adenosine(37)-N6)-dimethylallyltransferase MiaA [Candidatus Nomurabacteria bacterium]